LAVTLGYESHEYIGDGLADKHAGLRNLRLFKPTIVHGIANRIVAVCSMGAACSWGFRLGRYW
jgi:hypothetical protein